MILGFMQPYFLPYPGYFALIQRADRWVVFDDAQMIRHGWVDRNRVLHPNEGWQYLKVPLQKHPREATIAQVQRVVDAAWGERLVRQLGHYRRAPHYDVVIGLLRGALLDAPVALSALNVSVLASVCGYLGLAFEPLMHSTIDYDRAEVQHPGDWARVVARVLGAKEYINPPGGRALFDADRFAKDGVQLSILRWSGEAYRQGRRPYEADLSIVDMMMWLDPGEIVRRLDALAPAEEPALDPSSCAGQDPA
jgi:hypothetical protein